MPYHTTEKKKCAVGTRFVGFGTVYGFITVLILNLAQIA